MRLRYVRLYPANHIDLVMFVKYTRADEPFTFILLFYQTYRVSRTHSWSYSVTKTPVHTAVNMTALAKGLQALGQRDLTWTLMPIVATVIIVIWIIRSTLHLRKIAGPWWAPYTRLWLFRALYSERCADIYLQVNRQYGKPTGARQFSLKRVNIKLDHRSPRPHRTKPPDHK